MAVPRKAPPSRHDANADQLTLADWERDQTATPSRQLAPLRLRSVQESVRQQSRPAGRPPLSSPRPPASSTSVREPCSNHLPAPMGRIGPPGSPAVLTSGHRESMSRLVTRPVVRRSAPVAPRRGRSLLGRLEPLDDLRPRSCRASPTPQAPWPARTPLPPPRPRAIRSRRVRSRDGQAAERRAVVPAARPLRVSPPSRRGSLARSSPARPAVSPWRYALAVATRTIPADAGELDEAPESAMGSWNGAPRRTWRSLTVWTMRSRPWRRLSALPGPRMTSSSTGYSTRPSGRRRRTNASGCRATGGRRRPCCSDSGTPSGDPWSAARPASRPARAELAPRLRLQDRESRGLPQGLLRRVPDDAPGWVQDRSPASAG